MHKVILRLNVHFFHELTHISLNIGPRLLGPHTLEYPFPLADHIMSLFYAHKDTLLLFEKNGWQTFEILYLPKDYTTPGLYGRPVILNTKSKKKIKIMTSD